MSVADLNADGWDDLFITSSMNYPWRYHYNSLMLNNQGETFLDAEFILGIEPRREGWTMTPLFSLECSGADSKHALCAGKTGTNGALGALGSRSSVAFDFDRDGDLDMVVNELYSQPQVFVSDLAASRKIHFLQVSLVGKKSNRNGIGAKVSVVSGSKRQVKLHDGSSGYLSHSLLPLYFGLGDSESVERVEVRWPDGSTQVVSSAIPVNGTLVVSQP